MIAWTIVVSVYRFTDDEPNVTSLLAFTIKGITLPKQLTPCRSPKESLIFWGTTLQKYKRKAITASFIAYPITGFLRKSSSPFLSDTALSIPLGKDYTHLLHQPSDTKYIYPEHLGYVIWIPSTHNRAFSALRMIFIHVLIDQENFLYEDGAALYCVHYVYVVFQ